MRNPLLSVGACARHPLVSFEAILMAVVSVTSLMSETGMSASHLRHAMARRPLVLSDVTQEEQLAGGAALRDRCPVSRLLVASHTSSVIRAREAARTVWKHDRGAGFVWCGSTNKQEVRSDGTPTEGRDPRCGWALSLLARDISDEGDAGAMVVTTRAVLSHESPAMIERSDWMAALVHCFSLQRRASICHL